MTADQITKLMNDLRKTFGYANVDITKFNHKRFTKKLICIRSGHPATFTITFSKKRGAKYTDYEVIDSGITDTLMQILHQHNIPKELVEVGR